MSHLGKLNLILSENTTTEHKIEIKNKAIKNKIKQLLTKHATKDVEISIMTKY